MKKILPLICLLFIPFTTFAQVEKNSYFQFDLAAPLKANPDREQTDSNENGNNSWFVPDGLSGKIGYGIHNEKWVSIGIHSGIDWKVSEKLVVIPVFANFKLSPKIGEEARLYLQLGYGKSFGLGRGPLMGAYKKISLGIEGAEGISLFAEIAEYDFVLNKRDPITSFSLGLSIITF